ncbi:MAG: quinone-dependent dihydroorotate dehydrogenase [Halobacteria archaeon]|nr:quinone-dependent dihydroorotate dehydrogenase [Halobacteria archaeon]
MLYSVARRYLFRKDPEDAHDQIIKSLEFAQRRSYLMRVLRQLYYFEDDRLSQEIMGLEFDNPLGIAAGFDKNARVPKALSSLGFGHIEIGGVTAREQEGNPRPRLFRLPEDDALINRMGFNNEGADRIARRMEEHGDLDVPVGVNIGKSKDSEDPVQDYLYTFRAMREKGDYFVVNVSSPNTPGLRNLQQKKSLKNILEAIGEENHDDKPLLVKISPDLSEEALDEVIDVADETGLDGIIAVNTTTSRENLNTKGDVKEERGGLSGKPLRNVATRRIDYLYTKTGGEIPIIGVGGIFTAEDAYEKIKAGASLVQLYTGMVYEGPKVAKNINKGLTRLMEEEGLSHISEAVGRDSGTHL